MHFNFKKGSFYFLLAIGFVFAFSGKALAQDWQKNIENDSNFFSIQKAYYNDPDNAVDVNEPEEDGPKELYKRWEHFMATRVNEHGNPFAPNIIYKEWAKYQAEQKNNGKNKSGNKNGDWSYLGPITAPGNAGGTGRINCIRFTPGKPYIMWAGTPSGGLWKSIDTGNTWQTNTDNIPNLGVTDVAINPRNTDTMFMATGDGYGYSIANGTYFGGSYSNGVMRSIDGGNTWDTTSLNWDRTKARQIFRLLIYPEDPNIVMAVTNSGIWRTLNGGNTWKNVLASKTTDIKMNVTKHGTMYAAGFAFYISNDTGATWQKVNVTYPAAPSGIVIGTTKANDSLIYMLATNGIGSATNTSVLKSLDGGKTWTTMSTVTTTTFYGYYTSGLAINPTNPDEVTLGGLNMVRSKDGGATWKQLSYDYGFPFPYYVHPDHRVFEYYPGSKDTVFDGNDGGLYRSTDGGNNWKLMSNDIHVLELYRIGSGPYDPTLLYTGAQDNGVNQLYDSVWVRALQGDGMTCQVAWDNPAIGYGSSQNGYLSITENFGNSWNHITLPSIAGTPNWTAPFVMDPVEPGVMYFGGAKLLKSTDQGYNWTSINDFFKSSSNISNIEVAPSDNQTIYFSFGSDQLSAGSPRLYRTDDGGTTWISITKGLTAISSYLTGIAVDKYDSKHMAISISGYAAAQKVFISKDGGATYTNISTGLPNIPVNCIIFENSEENGLFVGTDVGVFYRNDNTGGWVAYNNGLPNVIVDQLEVFPAAYKIRAATYGRGVWDGTLAGKISGIEKMTEIKTEINVFPNPSTSGVFTIGLPVYKTEMPAITVYNLVGQKMSAPARLLRMDNGKVSNLDLSYLSEGIYVLNFTYSDGMVSKKVQILK